MNGEIKIENMFKTHQVWKSKLSKTFLRAYLISIPLGILLLALLSDAGLYIIGVVVLLIGVACFIFSMLCDAFLPTRITKIKDDTEPNNLAALNAAMGGAAFLIPEITGRPLTVAENEEKVSASEQLVEISGLKDNNVRAFSEKLIDKVGGIIARLETPPYIYPAANNMIQLEYAKKTGEYLEFDVYEDRVEWFKIGVDNTETEGELSPDNYINEMTEMVSVFLKLQQEE